MRQRMDGGKAAAARGEGWKNLAMSEMENLLASASLASETVFGSSQVSVRTNQVPTGVRIQLRKQ